MRAAVLNGRMYVMGGFTASPRNFPVEVYSSTNGINWDLEANSPTMWGGRTSFGCCTFNGRIYIAGGDGGSVKRSDVWSYDGTSWRNETLLALPGGGTDGLELISGYGGMWLIYGRQGTPQRRVYAYTPAGWQLETGDSEASYVSRFDFSAVAWKPNGAAQPELRIMGGQSENGSTLNDVWSAPIFLSSVPEMRVTYPSAGAIWPAGEIRTITWATTDNTSGQVKLQLWKGNKRLSFLTGILTDTGTFDWTIPANLTPGSDYRIYAYNPNYTLVDYSDYFQISNSQPLYFLSPAGGETYAGTRYLRLHYRINNPAVGAAGNIKIRLQKASLGTPLWYSPEIDVPAATGEYYFDFTLPGNLAAGSDYRFFIYRTDYAFISSSSDFTISASAISVSSPAAGVAWKKGTTVTISGTVNRSLLPNGSSGSPEIWIALEKSKVTKKFIKALSFPSSNSFNFSYVVPSDLNVGSDYTLFLYSPRVTTMSPPGAPNPVSLYKLRSSVFSVTN